MITLATIFINDLTLPVVWSMVS